MRYISLKIAKKSFFWTFRLLLFMLLCFTGKRVQAQQGTTANGTSPGGVSRTGFTVWLKSDEGTFFQGNPVTAGNADVQVDRLNNLVTNSPLDSVVFIGANNQRLFLQANYRANFNPHLFIPRATYLEATDSTQATDLFSPQENTIFIISGRASTSPYLISHGQRGPLAKDRYANLTFTLSTFNRFGGNRREEGRYTVTKTSTQGNNEKYYLNRFFSNSKKISAVRNGDSRGAQDFEPTFPDTVQAIPDHAEANGKFSIGSSIYSQSDPNTTRGSMNFLECIVFKRALTDGEINRVESYLALKYGITLDENNQQYAASDGTIIWNPARTSGYGKVVGGIGRDDASDLLQNKSWLMSGVQEGFSPLLRDRDDIFTIEAESPLNDGQFLAWGINSSPSSSIEETQNEVPQNREITHRIPWEWYVQEAGETDSLTLTFNKFTNKALTSSTASIQRDFNLLIDDDGDFTTGLIEEIPASSYDPNSGTVVFKGVNLSDNQYFTVSTRVIRLQVGFSKNTGNNYEGFENRSDSLPQLAVIGGVITQPYEVTISPDATAGTATAGSDYTPKFQAPVTVTIPVGDYTKKKTIAIPGLAILNDSTVEADETINLKLNPPPATSLIQLDSKAKKATYTIKDDDQLKVSFLEASTSGAEQAGDSLPRLTVEGGVTTGVLTVNVVLDTVAGTATASSDYTPNFQIPITVTLPAGDYTKKQTIPVPGLAIVDDNVAEIDETINLKLSPPTSPLIALDSQATTTYTIKDDDELKVSFLKASTSGVEQVGDSLPQLTVEGGVTTRALTVNVVLDTVVGTATAGSDYTPNFQTPVTVTLPAGDYTTKQTIAVPGLAIVDDNVAEIDETINLKLPSPTSPLIVLDSRATTTYTIRDDDELKVSFLKASTSGVEQAGDSLPRLAVEGGVTTGVLTVNVVLDAIAGTAMAGSDYTPNFQTPITVTLPAGDYTTQQTIAVSGLAVINDHVAEADETINLQLSPPVSPLIALGSRTTTTYTIKDDDNLKVSFFEASTSDVEQAGGNLPQLTVKGGVTIGALTVNVVLDAIAGTATAGSDYIPNFQAPITVTLPAGNYITQQTIAVPGLAIVNDNISEIDETINLKLSPPTSPLIALGNRATVTYTIKDDDELRVSFLEASTSDVEQAGGNLPRLTVTGGVTTGALTVNVALGATAGTATAGSDYTPNFQAPLTVPIPAGDYTTQQTIAVPGLAVVDDNVAESDETINLQLSPPTSPLIALGSRTTATYTIKDDDNLKASFLEASTSGVEQAGDNLPRLVVEGGVTTRALTVNVVLDVTAGTATAGSDYTPDFQAPLTVIIPMGNYTTQQTIAVPGLAVVDDNVAESDETINLQLSPPNSPLIALGSRTTATYTIKDDDNLKVSFLEASTSDVEQVGGNLPRLTVMGGVTTGALTVNVVLDVTAGTATAGSDYTPDFQTPLTVTLPAGDYTTQQTIPVPGLAVVDDKIVEGDETINLQLEISSPQILLGTQSSTVYTIQDNDTNMEIDKGFSPNGDGINDYWFVRNIEKFPNNVVKIYNRWGNSVYEEQGYNNQDKRFEGFFHADGLVVGSGELPSGTYYYIISLGDGSELISGYIEMIR